MSEMPSNPKPDDESARIPFETESGEIVELEVPADAVDEIAQDVNKGASY